jgi:hypothetical protein
MPEPVPGRLDITLKISQLPQAQKLKDGWKRFFVQAGDVRVMVTVRPKVFERLVQAQARYPLWIAFITGQMGVSTGGRHFQLEQPNLQVFERKPKPEQTPQPQAAAAE